MFAIIDEQIDVGALISAAQRPDCGAISTFVGTTRIDESGGVSVKYLEYEAYRPMADRKLEEIGGEIEERWDVREVSIVHRIGRVGPGEASVAIVVASPRRREAFEASRYAIERSNAAEPARLTMPKSAVLRNRV